MNPVSSSLLYFANPLRIGLFFLGALTVKILYFVSQYIKARKQFPGPAVANFWTGNLTETLTEDIHERWRRWHREFGPVYQTVCNFASIFFYMSMLTK